VIGSEEARELIHLARNALISTFRGTEFKPSTEVKEKYSQKMGAFVTLHSYPSGKLRGCVGIPYPVYPLWMAVVSSAISSAFKDPRFPPLREEDLKIIVIELSILTPPEEVPSDDLPRGVEVGKHGLIVDSGGIKGLLLPQVAEKYGWSSIEFLENTCLKAGLDRNCWKREDTKVYTFQALIFEEAEPWGKILRISSESR